MINKKNIPLVDKGKAREDVEMPNNNLANQKLKMEMCYRGIIFDRFWNSMWGGSDKPNLGK